ncbi:hypothetical protein EYV94_07825 [Puteibacter caeruleilacunae]|nr:hypothetical protein EYV94_07825 [Puteibacter caeruleilacunae]
MVRVFYYNPTCEMAIANGTVSWQPNQLLQRMESDCGMLPLVFAADNDKVLVHQLPEKNHLLQLRDLGFDVPEFLQLPDAAENPAVIGERISSLEPWGWSPAAHHLLRHLKPSCSDDFKLRPNAVWSDEVRTLYSREFALKVLAAVLKAENADDLVAEEHLPRVCTSLPEVEELLVRWGTLMVKAPFSSSGRGIQPVTTQPMNESIYNRIRGMIRQQKLVMVEPLHDRIEDFAFQFHLDAAGVHFGGLSWFKTGDGGQYEGNIIAGKNRQNRPESVGTPLHDRLLKLADRLKKVLMDMKVHHIYHGVIGVDGMLFNEDGDVKIYPCLEINFRYNMGYLAHQLDNVVADDAKGYFATFFNGKDAFGEFAEQMSLKYPIVTSQGHVQQGFVPIVSPTMDRRFGAYMVLR